MSFKKLNNSIAGLFRLFRHLKIFNPQTEFQNKRVVIIGAADSIYNQENGNYIDQFDIVIRVNKAVHNLNPSNYSFVGSRTTHLFHSFYENEFSGGGLIDWELFDKVGVKKVINPNRTYKGIITHLNYYKRKQESRKTYIISSKNYNRISNELNNAIPTIGFSTLMLLLDTKCAELFITGFTFFKTPYVKGYRDELLDMDINREHINKQGIHDIELEFEIFKKSLTTAKPKKVTFDADLKKIIENSFIL